jgi:hypothetical protein
MTNAAHPRRITAHKATSPAEAERLDRRFWAALTAAERVGLTWRLSEELWLWKEGSAREPGLPRSVARTRRR